MEKMFRVANQKETFVVYLFGEDPNEVEAYVKLAYNRHESLFVTQSMSNEKNRPVVNLKDLPSGSFFRPCHDNEDLEFEESDVVIQKIRQSYDLPVVQVLQFSKYRLRQLKELRDLWWVRLPERDRDHYYATTGIIGFLEDNLPLKFLTSLTNVELDDILNYICY